MESSNEDEAYKIVDWVPIWVDHGARLKELLEQCKDLEDEAFMVLAVMLQHHIAQDLKLHRLAQKFFSSDQEDLSWE